jgi:hypothetical protein
MRRGFFLLVGGFVLLFQGFSLVLLRLGVGFRGFFFVLLLVTLVLHLGLGKRLGGRGGGLLGASGGCRRDGLRRFGLLGSGGEGEAENAGSGEGEAGEDKTRGLGHSNSFQRVQSRGPTPLES